MMYDRVAPTSRTDFVLASIKDDILSGRLLPGQALVETELAAALGVSKTPVREALKLLAGSGLVVMSNYKGASVRIVDGDLARSVSEVRALLEPEAVRRAVLLGADFRPARTALEEAADPDLATRSLANRRFHRALYAGCRNPLMVQVLDGLRDQAALITVAGWGLHPTWEAETHEHQELLMACEANEAHRAADLLLRHITGFADRVAEGLPHGG